MTDIAQATNQTDDCGIPDGRHRPQAAAGFLGITNSTLSKWRLFGCGPEFVRIGPRLVAYEAVALRAFIRAGKRRSTSDRGGQVHAAA